MKLMCTTIPPHSPYLQLGLATGMLTRMKKREDAWVIRVEMMNPELRCERTIVCTRISRLCLTISGTDDTVESYPTVYGASWWEACGFAVPREGRSR